MASWLIIFLSVIGIHVFELICVLFYLLIKKNSKLEKTLIEQNKYIDNVNFLMQNLNTSLHQIDDKIWVQGDETLKDTFDQIKVIKDTLDDFLK